jgi:HEAT repeats
MGDRKEAGILLGWLACVAGVIGACGCSNFWDQVTSTDFKFKQLFSKPDPLVVLRDSTDGDQRARALRSLREPLQNGGNQKDQDAFVQILTAAATTDKEPLCRVAAITTLAHFKDPRVPPVLIQSDQKAERDFDREMSTRIRQQALNALGENRSPEGCHWLIGVARAGAKEEGAAEKLQTLDVRLTAIRALGKYKEAEANDLLLHLLKSERDVAVRECAHHSLEVATGKKLPADAQAWESAIHGAPPQVATSKPGERGNNSLQAPTPASLEVQLTTQH